MRTLLAVLALLLAGGGVVWADSIPQIVDSTTTGRRTLTVFNDSGGALTSGAVVVWDNDDATATPEFDQLGYRYVTTTATADLIWVAGVVISDSIPDQQLGEIVVEGWVPTNVTGNLTEDTLVATSTTAGRMGDYSPAANTCALGRLIQNVNLARGAAQTDTCGSGNFCQMPVDVNISCQ